MSIAQPSVSKIAGLYQGNPEALKNRIATEPKGPTGLPLDLSKLMALNIDLTETDAAKRQQAMNALQQMQQQSPNGEPPTIAQSIQQQAADKAKALAVQQQRQQQGLQALMQQQSMAGSVPQGAPQPERQPSGIDELRTNLGENYAGGGIVAFNGEENSDVRDEGKPKLRQVTQRELAEEYNRKRAAQRAEDANKPEDEMLKLVKQPFRAAGRGIASLLSSLYGGKTPGATPEQTGPDMNLGDAIMRASANREASEDRRPVAIGTEGQRSLPSISGQPSAPAPAPRPPRPPSMGVNKPAAPTAPPAPTTPAEKSMYDKWMEQSLSQTPEARRDSALKRYQDIIGAPDTSAQEKYIQQLEARRAQFAEPTDPYERMRNYLRTAANAGGSTWMETGAKTSASMEQKRLANQQKDMEILKELMGESGKLADVKRGYKKEAFGFGEKEYDDAYKYGFEAAKEMGLNGRQRELFAQQSAENALQRANALKVAGMPGAEERMFGQFARDWMAKPENKGKTTSDAYQAYRLAGMPSAATKGIMTRDQASDNVMKKIAYDSPIRTQLMSEAKDALVRAGIASPSGTQITDYLISKELGSANAPVSSSGKVVDFSSLPK